jgi:hypothetical protein
VTVIDGKPLPSSIDTSKCSTKTKCLNFPGPKKNWDGEPVETGPWYDKKILKIGSLNITAGAATESLAGVMSLVAIITIACMYTAYRKQEKIKE